MMGFIVVVICSVLYAVKGGQHGFLVNKLREKSKILNRVLDGKVLSSLGFGLLNVFMTGSMSGLVAGLGWLIGVAPKMGRIVGDIGGYRGNWNAEQEQYPKSVAKDKAIEGWKAGLQRGVFIGAMIALFTDNLWFIVAGLLYPVTVFIGVSIQQKINKSYAAEWHYHEMMFGALIGIAYILN